MSKRVVPWFPTMAYHPREAPTGRKFTDEAAYLDAIRAGWVDTPAKFPSGGGGLPKPRWFGKAKQESV